MIYKCILDNISVMWQQGRQKDGGREREKHTDRLADRVRKEICFNAKSTQLWRLYRGEYRQRETSVHKKAVCGFCGRKATWEQEERETETARHRETERKRDRDWDRQKDRQRNRDREWDDTLSVCARTLWCTQAQFLQYSFLRQHKHFAQQRIA